MVHPAIRVGSLAVFSLITISVFGQATSPPNSFHGFHVEETQIIDTSAFTGRFPAAFVKSFDLAPDGKTLAVVFETHEGGRNSGIWITLWSLSEGTAIQKSKQLEEPRRDVRVDHNYRFQIRFDREGKRLFVLTGPNLFALAVPSLKVEYAIEAPVPPERRGKGPYIRDFSVASEANRIAVHYQSGIYPDPFTLEVQILDSKTGELKSKWTQRGFFSSISLSPDGRLLAAASNPISQGRRIRDKPNVFTYDATTGEVQIAFNAGYLVGHLQFAPEGGWLATSASEYDFADDSPQDSLKLWEIHTGKLLNYCAYPRHGVRGPIAISRDGLRLAVVSSWTNPTDRARDRNVIRGFARLLVWKLDRPESPFVSEDVRGRTKKFHDIGAGELLIGMSADGRRVAVGVGGGRISIYSIAEIALPPGSSFR